MLAMKRDLNRLAASRSPRRLRLRQLLDVPPGRRAPRRRRTASSRHNVDSLTYVSFEDQFRSERAEIRRRVGGTRADLRHGAARNVLDIGCGRGELLTRYRKRHQRAQRGRESGHDRHLPPWTWPTSNWGMRRRSWQKQPDASAGGLVAVQAVSAHA